MSDFTLPNDTPIILLECETAFNSLTEKEKLYAHYLARGSRYGGLIVLTQTSLESPLIYTLLYNLFKHDSIEDLKQIAIAECEFTEEDFKAVLVYTSGIFSNMGNYKSFGDTKFIPNLPQDKFKSLIKASNVMKLKPDKIEYLLSNCLDAMFSLEDKERLLGFPYVGSTKYLSKNFTKEDTEIVTGFFKKLNLEAYNSRLFKMVDETGEIKYEIRLASTLSTDDEIEKNLLQCHNVNDHKFVVTRGDYSELLKLTNQELLKAKEFAANENEIKMIENYIKSFNTGSLDAHKDGSRYWIKNKRPVIETYIGFIETYRDPAGMRGEFEGFVAMVNKPMSAKFTELVRRAEEFLLLLPWPSTYEKDKFLQPDFTSLDVLTFAGSEIPAGICIPNYDDIKQDEGFKNVSLGNVLSSVNKGTTPNFLSAEDRELLLEHIVGSFEVQVGLHELLGHGSGKLFKKEKDGSLNFDVATVLHLETNEKISKWYEEGETYDSVFSSLSSSYEECRAECVGLYLSTLPEILKIFGYEGAVADDVMYVNWMSMGYSGLKSLQMYEPKTEMWLQAHCQASYVILQVLLEADDSFVTVKEVTGEDGKPDLLYSMDRSKILTVGKPAIEEFLKKLQLYRATADVASARSMYNKYSAVTKEGRHPFLSYREIVVARKKPRKLFVEANTIIEDGKVHLKSYPSSHEGMIQSWMDRFKDDDLDDILKELYLKDKPYF